MAAAVPVQELNKRLHVIARVFPLRPRVRASLTRKSLNPEVRVQEFVRALWHWSGRQVRDDFSADLKAWERIKKSNMLPNDLLRGLCHMYLGLRTEALLAETFDEFIALIRPRWDGYEAFKPAIEFYEKSRWELQLQMREYYHSRNADKDLALVTAPGWIPDQPILMAGKEVVEPQFRLEAGDTRASVVIPTIPGLEEPLHEARRALNPDSEMYDGETYRPLDVHVGPDGLRLTCGRGRYFDYHDTCEILGIELAGWMLANRGLSALREGANLPWRKRVDDIFNLRNRHAVLGVSTLLIALHGRKQGRFFWHQRDHTVAVNPDVRSVVPSGTFQPFTANFGLYPGDFNITATVLREFAEELLGEDDLEKPGMRAVPIEEKVQRLQPFMKQMEDGHLKIHFLGIGIDPVTTVPEVMTVMTFREDLLQRPVKFKDNFEGTHGDTVLSREALELFSDPPLGENFHSASSACARLAARHYDRLVMDRSPRRAA
jgi:hypothetical protein